MLQIHHTSERLFVVHFTKHADGERQIMYITEIFYSQRSIAGTCIYMAIYDRLKIFLKYVVLFYVKTRGAVVTTATRYMNNYLTITETSRLF